MAADFKNRLGLNKDLDGDFDDVEIVFHDLSYGVCTNAVQIFLIQNCATHMNWISTSTCLALINYMTACDEDSCLSSQCII